MVGGQVHHGHDGLSELWWLEGGWESVEWEVTDVIDAGEHLVLVVDQRSRGRMSGAEVKSTLESSVTG